MKSREDKVFEKYYSDVKWKPWQQNIIDIVAEEPDMRKIYWVVDRKGNSGKTWLAKYLWLKYRGIVASGKKDNVFNQCKTWCENNPNKMGFHLAIIDVPRSNIDFISYTAIEKVKDGFLYSGKYEGGVCVFGYPHVIVFANEEPDYSKMSEDRWVVIDLEDDSDLLPNDGEVE